MPLADAAVIAVGIANGASLSGAAHLGAGRLVGLDLPTLTDAALTFQVSVDGLSYREALDDAGTPVSVAAGTGAAYWQAPASLGAAPYLKVRSGTVDTPVNQGAARTIRLVAQS
jgi:hypothetical protein